MDEFVNQINDSLSKSNILLRPIQAEDSAFLFKVFASSLLDDASFADWATIQDNAILKMQFNAQENQYRGQFSNASFNLIELNQIPVGRYYLDKADDTIRIIDITLLPAFRNQSIGKTILSHTLKRAGQYELPVHLHVNRTNPAQRLYTRLGFKQVAETDTHLILEWVASSSSSLT